MERAARRWAESKERFCQQSLAGGKAPRTISNWAGILRRYGRWAVARGLDPLDCDPTAYLAAHRQEVTSRTVYNEAVCLRAFLRWQGKDASGIRLRFPPLKPQPPYSEEELGRLFSIANERERSLIKLLLTTGLRPSELVSIAENGGVSAEVVTVAGKGGRSRRVALASNGWRPRSYGILYRTLRELGLKAGVRCTAQRFRVTFAHMLLQRTDIQAVQLAMGHARLTTTAHYLRWGAEDRALAEQRAFAESIADRL